jgi:hypothetical protein
MRSRRTPEALKSKVWEQLRTMLPKNGIRTSSGRTQQVLLWL